MKRFISMLLVVMSVLTLALMPISCAQPSGDEQGATTATPEATEPENGECAHEFLDFTTEPTYTDKGFTTHTCKKCGYSYKDSFIDAWADVVLQYDDYVTELDGIAVSANPTITGDDCIEIITKEGATYFHAKDLGVATVTSGDKEVVVAIGKARLHLVLIMGQSNAGCHFANAMSDVKCDLGTAYWWASDTRWIDYTRASSGFHAPLVAELRAQSVAAGNPEKPVMIWNEGMTTKSGEPITYWATSKNDTSGTDNTMKMVNAAINYYTDPARADKFEIVEAGMYWLQGEGNVDPVYYTECFLAMWNRVKTAGYFDYCAIMRVRRGVSFNQTVNDHNDLMHHGSVRAQMEMVNKYDDIYLATDITENWYGVAGTKHSVDISKYITMMNFYGKSATYADTLGNTATFKDGILTTSMHELYGDNNWCHYGKFGYGILGADAAYNMYKALHADEYGVVYSDTTGMVHNQIRAKAGETHEINLANVSGNLTFRPEAYSTAGTLTVKVTKSGNTDVTNLATIKTATVQGDYMTISKDKLASYNDVVITVTYTPKDGESGTVTFKIVK